MRHVESRAETDFQHMPVRGPQRLFPLLLKFLPPHDPIHEARDDMIGVQAHRRTDAKYSKLACAQSCDPRGCVLDSLRTAYFTPAR